jgi:hypothetical protein
VDLLLSQALFKHGAAAEQGCGAASPQFIIIRRLICPFLAPHGLFQTLK